MLSIGISSALMLVFLFCYCLPYPVVTYLSLTLIRPSLRSCITLFFSLPLFPSSSLFLPLGRVGFVPQDEVLDRGLTVRELLMYHARARQAMPTPSGNAPSSGASQGASGGVSATPSSGGSSSSSPSASSSAGTEGIHEKNRSSIVDKVLSDLSIRHIADTIIGGDMETQVATTPYYYYIPYITPFITILCS